MNTDYQDIKYKKLTEINRIKYREKESVISLTMLFLFLGLGFIAIFCTNCASKMESAHREALLEGSNAIIVDHTCTDISKIPIDWPEKAKELTIYYAHTSHGSQIISGAKFLAKQNPQYGFAAKHTNANHPHFGGIIKWYVNIALRTIKYYSILQI